MPTTNIYIYEELFSKTHFNSFHEIDIFLPRPIHFVNIQFIMLKWILAQSGSVRTC